MHLKNTLLLLGIYLIILISKKTGLYFPELINSYGSDLICIPLVLSLARWGVMYVKNDASIRLNALQIFSTVIIFGWTFEMYLPQQSSIYTADPIDFLLYVVGGLFFYFFQPQLKEAGQINKE